MWRFDCVEGQGRGIRRLSGNFTEGHKPQLNQGPGMPLQIPRQRPFAFVHQLHDRFLNLRILEGGGKEFGAAVRFVACGEAAGEHDDLGFIDGFFKFSHGIPDVFGAQVLKYLGHHAGAGAFKGSGAVVFTVGSREYGDEYGGLCHLVFANIDAVSLIQTGIYRICFLACPGGEYFSRVPFHAASMSSRAIFTSPKVTAGSLVIVPISS